MCVYIYIYVYIYSFSYSFLFHYGLSQNIVIVSCGYTVGPCCFSILQNKKLKFTNVKSVSQGYTDN